MKNPDKNNYEGWPTTRCYPRTLAEAFPQDYMADWWEGHKRPAPTWNDVLFYALTVLALVMLANIVS
jgi:hypothetical protein